MRNRGVSDDDIANSLDYASKQSLWNWISRNRSKFANDSDAEIGFWDNLMNIVAGSDKSAYFGGLFIGYFIRQLLDTGERKIDFENKFSIYHSIWISFFFNSSFKKGVVHGIGLTDAPVLISDLSDWYEQIRNNK